MDVIPLFPGFPGSSSRGFLGWSSCVLLKGQRPMLFDTAGYNERYRLLEALAAHGVAPREIAAVFLSHFHFDHAVNYQLFPNATLYLHERERAYAEAEHERDLAIPIEALSDLEATRRLTLLAGDEGEVEGIPWRLAPGHTAGLYALRLEQNGKTVILASDAVKNIAELRTGEVAMAWNREASRETVGELIGVADVILPGHDRLVKVVRDATTGEPEFFPEAGSGVTVSLAAGVSDEHKEWRLEV